MPDQAEAQFRNAIGTDYNNAAAHAQLAMLLEKKGDLTNARTEAQTSVRLKPNVDGAAGAGAARLEAEPGSVGQPAKSIGHWPWSRPTHRRWR